ncbi:chaoptin-like [Rhopalosiphum maidis]|uniref:chaoptin-like n=1 Tax=Rhopalosiphum maidis TaxID=43146 RepID=UPI000F006C63|nr:chaoptin-like [Rhopalosiphum maidis]XP_026815823.1 chaoptin-like [Rhopalosiphum maidis]XP_026815824.1 chaoptin-like [Rhopalosiphum maidis]XP_026815825.1 chaoptin-like [Rhopalosiphum maidis]XP_026818089.1 chaoptin-like [Rhopalosiphum maidis]XP_026818090.1 chaoptin-like [Rhopalosiphum maidis]XP_026818091.1 chaoptin-like [Rhopalosiphum maidis]XP_026818092.1 chaoptin-like [Rhopalosiphum maidis]
MANRIFLILILYVYCINAEYTEPGPKYRCPKIGSLPELALHPCRCVAESDNGLALDCENSNLASLSVGFSNVASLGDVVVDNLTISSCNIGRLFGDIFYSISVNRLIIQDTPIRLLDDDLFFGINHTLSELHIVNSKLAEFPSGPLKILGNLKVLRLDKHAIFNIPTNSFASSQLPTRLEKLYITNGKLTSLSPDSLGPCKKLKYLDLQGNELGTLQKNQFKGLRDLETLDISNNNISKIESSHFGDLTKLVSINLANNSLPSVTRGSFARNTLLRVLNLSHNKLTRLDSELFRGMRFLRRLYLSDNEIAQVDRGTFASMTRIGTIDLARNRMQIIDYQMFSGQNYVEIIDVSENQITKIEKLSFKNLYLVRINLSKNNISEIDSGAFENCANITMLDMSYNSISNIPSTAFDNNTYATVWQLSYNNLTDMSQVPVTNMAGIKILNVTHNNIKVIPKGTFPKLYELHTLDFSYNRIKSISPSVFQSLLSLRSINLSHNALEDLKSTTFGTLPTVLELYLNKNSIKKINAATFVKMSSLSHLDLRHNNITQIPTIPISLSSLVVSHNIIKDIGPDRAWPSMNALLSLDLSYNMLGDSLNGGSFSKLLSLQSLILDYNSITIPPAEALSQLVSTRHLSLRGNSITHLSTKAFGILPVVFYLDLSQNNITQVESQAFDGLLQLQLLNLTENSLTEIPNGAFKGLVSLTTLDVSHNLLHSLDNKTNSLLDDCLSLKYLNLSHNQFSFFTKKSFPNHMYTPSYLESIDISYNEIPIITNDITVGTHKVKYLNLSHNSIDEIRPGVLGNLTSLNVLDLSFNNLESMKKVGNMPKNMSVLLMSNNKLTKLSKEIVSFVPKLKDFNVENNLFNNFPPELAKIVTKGTSISFKGNPIECDCSLIPIKRMLNSKLNPDPQWDNITCVQLLTSEVSYVSDLGENELICDIPIEDEDDTFVVTPDVKFRQIKRSGSSYIKIDWFVLQNKEDIADFVIFTGGNKLEERSSSRLIPYNLRSQTIKAAFIKDSTNLCIIPKDSFGNERQMKKGQCMDIGELGPLALNNAKQNSKNIYLFYSMLILSMVKSLKP